MDTQQQQQQQQEYHRRTAISAILAQPQQEAIIWDAFAEKVLAKEEEENKLKYGPIRESIVTALRRIRRAKIRKERKLREEQLKLERQKAASAAPTMKFRLTVKAPPSASDIWSTIATKHVPAVNKIRNNSRATRLAVSKKIAVVVSREAKRFLPSSMFLTTAVVVKEAQVGTTATTTATNAVPLFGGKKGMREMLAFWKKYEKEEKEKLKRAEKEKLEKLKEEDERREARRQARKLNFLIEQTEIFSHFVGQKLDSQMKADGATKTGGAEAKATAELDFADDDDATLRARAEANAAAALREQQQRTASFDEDRKTSKSTAPKLDSSGQHDPIAELDFKQTGNVSAIEAPAMLKATMKSYQLQGLSWLVNLYEQGINGILADEMGLGKTIQTLAVMAHLAEKEGVWGPFLVVTPASTLHNWVNEIDKFTPELRALPYWGNPEERKILRKYWSKRQVYSRETPYHIVITSYQLSVTDMEYFKRQKWQYMILDEAHAIKSSASARWQTLMKMNCRNRLLLTGTPVQNNMKELWALLNFIMPSLFDSHEEFNAWFSNDIETSVKSGQMADFNEHQLKRLHMILKPFMLRRVKKDVQNELGAKIEKDVYCNLTHRQRAMYKGLKQKMSLVELLARFSLDSNPNASADSLLNLVIQFRKVCNHPELFERADVDSPLLLRGGVIHQEVKEGRELKEEEVVSQNLMYSGRGLLHYRLPKLVCKDGGILELVCPNSRSGIRRKLMRNMFNIFCPENVVRSSSRGGTFSFLRFCDTSPSELSYLTSSGILQRWVHHLIKTHNPHSSRRLLLLQENHRILAHRLSRSANLNRIARISRPDHSDIVSRSSLCYLPPALGLPVDVSVSDRDFTLKMSDGLRDELNTGILLEIPQNIHSLNAQHWQEDRSFIRNCRYDGIEFLGKSPADQGWSPMRVPHLGKLITDSGKISVLDDMLPRLKAEGHRCLIYFQMTKMMDLFEEYLTYRQYNYLRMDGNTLLSDRRDMVSDFQTRDDIFIFMLSTRAGGIGINLTAADTVIFYDSDWNPTVDQQAMDRAHRLGQTRQVTVYRLVTKGSIEERILVKAKQKDEIQKMVISGGDYRQDVLKPKEIVSLLLDDEEMEMQVQKQIEQRKADDARRVQILKAANEAKRAIDRKAKAESKKQNGATA